MSKDNDVFRDTPLRLAGYANEVGESFKPVISRGAYVLSYVASGAYVLGDAHDKYGRERRSTGDDQAALTSGFKALVWQGLASVLIPGFVVNRIVATAGYVALNMQIKDAFMRRYSPTFVGLASIPLIIKPIDGFVDLAFEHIFDPTIHALAKASSEMPRQ